MTSKNNTNPDFTPETFKDSFEELKKRKGELLASMTENYIIDRICEQRDLETTLTMTEEERSIVNSVFYAFALEKINDRLQNHDRDGLIKSLNNLLQIPEINHSEKITNDIHRTLVRLNSQADFHEAVAGGFLLDWLMITKYWVSFADMQSSTI